MGCGVRVYGGGRRGDRARGKAGKKGSERRGVIGRGVRGKAGKKVSERRGVIG